jgi:hypothetical protein
MGASHVVKLAKSPDATIATIMNLADHSPILLGFEIGGLLWARRYAVM